MSPESLLARLERLGIPYIRRDHVPVHTCEQADEVVADLSGARTKNLFLHDRRGRRHVLLVIRPDIVVDLKSLGERLGARGLSFASPERLERYLGVSPGAVSLLALVNDTERAVELVIDAPLWAATHFQCHPLVNTVTLVVPRDALVRLYAETGHAVNAVDLPLRAAAP